MYLPCIAKINEVYTFTVHDSQYETDSSSLILAMHGKYMYCTRQSVWDWQFLIDCIAKINEVYIKVTVSLILNVVYSTCIYPAVLKSMRFVTNSYPYKNLIDFNNAG
jgi:hypothetical protein